MQDLAYLFLIAVFVAAAAGTVAGCGRPGSAQVSGLYLLCGVVAAGLLVYLVVALFNAENL